MVLVLAYHLMMVYICTKFHENILNRIRVMKWTRKVNGRTDGHSDGRRAHNMTCLRRVYKNGGYSPRKNTCLSTEQLLSFQRSLNEMGETELWIRVSIK